MLEVTDVVVVMVCEAPESASIYRLYIYILNVSA